eukprot:g126.t1
MPRRTAALKRADLAARVCATRRRLLAGLGAALATGAAGLSGKPARAADYPPTDGAMQGFILLESRRPATRTPFFDAAGNVRQFGDFAGQALLVNFWATWCAPCIREMPALARLQDSLGGPDFSVLAISQDRGGAAVAEPFVRERLGLPDLPLLYDPKLALGRSMGVQGLPTTFAIDRRGRVVGYLTGLAEWDSPDAKRLIRHLIDEAGPEAVQDA